ncbi:MAG TPA: DUF1015 domain-containing protein [Terriglobales bacterium]|nr:DUF1015 domain-containing protein [Terriglobales bacterium]
MAEIAPFAALRYDPEKVQLRDVITQPYDKITPEMQDGYYKASPFNLIRIILGRPEGPETDSQNRYTQAAGYLKAWREKGILAQDSSPSIYAYAQKFTIPGTNTQIERRGFIAIGRLHDYADRVVYRHEQTLPKAKSDRLRLLNATHAHFGQLFMLYSDPAQSIDALLFDDERYAWQELTDEYGVLHRVRRISDPAALNIVQTEMADKKLIIADGHHRYETALNFRNEIQSKNANGDLREKSNFAMMTFINMDSPGLVILPTHRVVYGLDGFDVSEFVKKARGFYEVKELGQIDAAKAAEALSQSGKRGISFVAATKKGSYLLRAKPESTDSLPAQFSPRQRKLDIVHLHSLLLDRCLGVTPEQVTNMQHIRYLRDAGEALAQVKSDPTVNVAFLTNPVSIDQVKEIAFAGEVLPQKSTDFYPKLLSGFAIYALE